MPALLVAGLLLSGCSDEVEGEAAPATTASSGSSSSSSGSSSPSVDPEVEDFCLDAEAVFEEVDDGFDEAGGLTGLFETLDQVVSAFDSLEPPADLEDDWQEARDGFAVLRDEVAALDPAAPDAQQQAEAILDRAQTEIGPEFARIGQWILANCPNA